MPRCAQKMSLPYRNDRMTIAGLGGKLTTGSWLVSGCGGKSRGAGGARSAIFDDGAKGAPFQRARRPETRRRDRFRAWPSVFPTTALPASAARPRTVPTRLAFCFLNHHLFLRSRSSLDPCFQAPRLCILECCSRESCFPVVPNPLYK